jgi:two-component system response regulator RegX3
LPVINILLVSSDQELSDQIATVLLAEQMTTSTAPDGVEALGKVDKQAPDAILVNIDQAGDWQVQLCAQIRERTMAPLLVVGSKKHEPALARSLNMGADAHVLSPFSKEVLLSQQYALLRRAGLARPGVDGKYDIGSLAIDLFSREVRVGGKPVELTPTEFEIVRCLLNNSGRALSYRSLVRQAQGYDCSPEEARRLLKVHIHNLRQKIEPFPEKPAHILNVRGFGYLFERRRFKRNAQENQDDASLLTES